MATRNLVDDSVSSGSTHVANKSRRHEQNRTDGPRAVGADRSNDRQKLGEGIVRVLQSTRRE